MSARRLFVVGLLVSCWSSLGSVGWAQENRGSISGSVVDATGAAIPSVPITATDLSRGLNYVVTSTAAGYFVISGLTIGDYRVEAVKEGFKKFIQQPVTVTTAGITTVNITLDVGAVTQEVTITGSASLLQTTDASISNLETGKMYQDLPLTMSTSPTYGSGRRQPEQFILTQPGVNTAIEGDLTGKTFNGGQYYSGIQMIDGVNTPTSLWAGQFEHSAPPYEAMAELKVQTSNLPAEYGGGSGLENLTMKSGTNVVHGDLYEFHRDDALTARGFNPTPQKSLFIENEFGGTIGGPVVIPHLYNGRNRTFIFGVVTDFRKVGGPPSTPTYTVPTQAERQGDFSALLQPANGGIQLYDPNTTTFNGTTYTRTPYPNNQLVNAAGQSELVSQATYWLKWMAPPNLPGSNGGLFNNFLDTVGSTLNEYTWSVKVDHSFNDRNRISWSYWGNDRSSVGYSDRYFDIPVSPGFWHGGGHRLHDYYTIASNIQNDAFAGYTETGDGGTCSPGAMLGDNPAHIPNLDYYNPNGTGQYRFGGTSSVNYFRSGGGLGGCVLFGNGVYAGQWAAVIQLGDNLELIHGRHDLKFGVDGWREANTDREVGGGWYTFAGLETGLGSDLGDAFASFLVGDADSSTIAGPNVGVQYHDPKIGAFAQDTWKVTSKLTANFGLRWDRPFVTTESFNRMAGFTPGVTNPAAGGIPGAMVFLGSGAGRTGSSTFPYVHSSNLEFAPRVGFAYALNSNTVIRTGYAFMYTYGNGDAMGFDEGGSPWEQGIEKYAANLSSPDNGIHPGTTLQGGLPVPNCTLPCINPSFENGGTPFLWDPRAGNEPYIEQWMFGVQHYFPDGFFVNANYIGNKGTRLPGDMDNWDQLPVDDMATYGTLLTAPYNSPAAVAVGIKAPYAGFSGTVGQALRPYPQYSAIADRFDPSGMSRYDSLQVSLRKNIGSMQLMINYTAEKNLADTSSGGAFFTSFTPRPAEDTYHLGLEKALVAYTAPQRIIASWVWDLPVGRGKRYVSGAHGVENQLLGGWELGAIQTYRDGFPDAVSGGVANPIFNTASRPNELAGVPVRVASCNDVKLNSTVLANINAFSKNSALQLGTAPRMLPDFRGCAWLDEDLSAQKQFPLTEKLHLEFRSEFYNIFNRHKFADPSLNIASPATFGQISGIDGQFQPRIIQFAMKLLW